MVRAARHTLISLANRFPKMAVAARRFRRRVQRPFFRAVTLDIVPVETLWPGLERIRLEPSAKVPTPDLHKMLLDRRALILKRPVYRAPAVFAALLDEPIVFPGQGVVMDAFGERVVAESYLANDVNDQYYRLPIAGGVKRDIPCITGYSLNLRSSRHNYYHTLIDNLARLAYLAHPALAALAEIKLLCPGSLEPMEAFFLSRLKLANVRVEEVKPGQFYRAERHVLLTFPTERFSGYLPPALVRQVQQAVWPNSARTASRRLYVSRARASKRRVLNEEAVWHVLKEWGFEKVFAEDYTPEEQVALFYDAAAVVAPHGAGLTNVLFAPPIIVIELVPTRSNIPYYYFLCKALGHAYHYLSGTANHKDHDFVVDVPRLEQVLRRALPALLHESY